MSNWMIAAIIGVDLAVLYAWWRWVLLPDYWRKRSRAYRDWLDWVRHNVEEE